MTAVIVLGMLAWHSLEDIRKMRIKVSIISIFSFLGIALYIYHRDTSLWSVLGGILLGLGVIGLGMLTRGGIGLGDGLVIAVCGLYLGFAQTMQLLLIALCYAAIWSLILLIFRKKSRKHEIPFVPFLLAAYSTMLIINILPGGAE